MNFIGNVIQEYRYLINMSRRELAADICSEKYIYLIERGERTPSADMTWLLGDRLGIDLFKYYKYLDCEDPIKVDEIIKTFNIYRAKNNMTELKKITDEAMHLPDFNKEPWVYEIEKNMLAYMVLKEGKYQEAIKEILRVLEAMEVKYSNSILVADFYVLLSTSYLLLMDFKNAKNASLIASGLVKNKKKNEQYSQVVITVKINKLIMHFLLGELDELIEEAHCLSRYEIEMNSYERSHHTLFYLGFAHYKKGQENQGLSSFMQGIHLSLGKYNPRDIYFLSSYDIFTVMMEDPRIPRELVAQFRKKYKEFIC